MKTSDESTTSLESFLATLPAMQAGRARKSLAMSASFTEHTGPVHCGERHHCMRQLVASGYRPRFSEKKSEYQMDRDGCFFVVTKIEHDFASYLLAAPVTQENPEQGQQAGDEPRYVGRTWAEIDAMQQGTHAPRVVSGPVDPAEILRDMAKFGIPVAKDTAQAAGIDMEAQGYRLDGDTWNPSGEDTLFASCDSEDRDGEAENLKLALHHIQTPVTCCNEAVTLLAALLAAGLNGHPEDEWTAEDAAACGIPLAAAEARNARMAECYALAWPPFCECPCAAMFALDAGHRREFATSGFRDAAEVVAQVAEWAEFDQWRAAGCPVTGDSLTVQDRIAAEVVTPAVADYCHFTSSGFLTIKNRKTGGTLTLQGTSREEVEAQKASLETKAARIARQLATIGAYLAGESGQDPNALR